MGVIRILENEIQDMKYNQQSLDWSEGCCDKSHKEGYNQAIDNVLIRLRNLNVVDD